MSKVRININGREIVTLEGKTILQAASDNGIEIPHLCYDERIKPYGACGLCVVEMEGSPKLVRACATFVQNGQVVNTNTDRTTAARKTALKLLASDHRGDCRPPCMQACPAHTDCQGYVGLIANGQYNEALKLIKEKLPIPGSIGKVCPHPCEEACRRTLVEEPIAIAALKSFVAELDLNGEKYLPPVKAATGKKVAVIGAGPAGLSAAYFLKREGHQVTVFEAMPHPGGMLRYGIPQYRLDKNLLDAEVEQIKKIGVEFRFNTKIGDDINLNYLQQNYDAVFLGIGSWQSQGLRCKGDDLAGVIGGIDFLRDVAMNKQVALGKKVLVVGGGNTAMDVARSAVRLGADEVTVLYRRTRDEMPAEDIEIEEAMEEGVKFQFLVAPIEVLGETGRAHAIKCDVMQLGEPDSSGRRKPEATGKNVVYEADTIIAAIGQRTIVGNISGVATDKSGNIVVGNGTFQTNAEKVFAGGDAVTGPKIAIDAVAQGKDAAKVITGYLAGKLAPRCEGTFITQQDITAEDFTDKVKMNRVALAVEKPEIRNKSFMQVAGTFTEEEALKESRRCLECGCRDYFECQLIKYIQEYNVNVEKQAGQECHKRKETDEHPYIERNADKCVLCGLCIRVCEEVMGTTALGLVGRGFDSVVKPEFELSLMETCCTSCGQCVDICPTGACMEKQTAVKQVPVELESVRSVCSYCGVGCSINVEHRGNVVFRITPDKTREEGLLCKRGKFGLNYVNDKARLTAPVVKREHQFASVNWEEAEHTMVKKLQAIQANYGADSIGIMASPRLTNEELFVARKLADVLNTPYLGSYSVDGTSGLDEVFGYDASTTSYAEISNCDFVLTVGELASNHPVMDNKLKLAGVSLQQWKSNATSTQDIKRFVKALIELGSIDEHTVAKRVHGFDRFKATLSELAINNAEIQKLAEHYWKAKRPIILIDEDSVTREAIKLFAYAAVITGKVGVPYRGILLVRSKNNTQGAVDMGFTQSNQSISQAIEQGKIKALVVIGENPASYSEQAKLLKKLEFLAVFDMFMTETAAQADIVMPLISSVETEGTYTRSDRQIQEILPALRPLTGKTNLELFIGILRHLGVNYENITQVRTAISQEIPTHGGIADANFAEDAVYWPNEKQNCQGTHVLYTKGFATSDGKAILTEVGDAHVFAEKRVYDTLELKFLAR